MNNWNNFNDAQAHSPYTLLPKGTIAPVRMTIKPGGYDDAAQGWTGGYATQSLNTGSVYLAVEFVVLDGPFARRKIWGLIGLFSPKGRAWGDMGRSFVRAALNSARNVASDDLSPDASAARCISGLQELDGIEFVAQIDQEKDSQGEWKNTIKTPIEPGHPTYAAARSSLNVATSSTMAAPVIPVEEISRLVSAPPVSTKPVWAQ